MPRQIYLGIFLFFCIWSRNHKWSTRFTHKKINNNNNKLLSCGFSTWSAQNGVREMQILLCLRRPESIPFLFPEGVVTTTLLHALLFPVGSLPLFTKSCMFFLTDSEKSKWMLYSGGLVAVHNFLMKSFAFRLLSMVKKVT